jgi:hypothetical protein
MTNMPDVTHFRRPPVILPPVIRTLDSTTPSKKSSGQPKISKQKSAIKSSQTHLEKEKEDILRYFIFLFYTFTFLYNRVLRRSHYGSLPNIHEKFLSEELDFNFNSIRKSKYKTTDIIRERYFIDEEKKVDDQ